MATVLASLVTGCQMWTDITSPWPHRRAPAQNEPTVSHVPLTSAQIQQPVPKRVAQLETPEPAVVPEISKQPEVFDPPRQPQPTASEANVLEKAPERLEMPVPVFPASVDWAVVPGGWVDVLITVGPEGTVIAVETLEFSHPSLVGPAVEAIRKARYPADQAAGGVSFHERIAF